MTDKQIGSTREVGASMIFVAASMFVLIGVAALAVDLSGLRLDRAIDQRVTDAAATAGAIAVFESDGRIGCQTALGYLALNAPEIAETAFVGYPCSSIPTSCSTADPASTETVSVGRFSISVVHPVPDLHPLMTSAAIGAPSQIVTAADLDQCDRIAVQIAADRETTFGRVLGSDSNTTTVHSVGVAYQGSAATAPVSLLLLDRTGCSVMRASGNGGIIVGAVQDLPNVYQGIGAADSNATNLTPSDPFSCDGSGESEGIIFKEGNNSLIRADGPPGCGSPPDDLTTPIIGEGCGVLQVFTATDGVSCSPSGCVSNGPPSVNPEPFPTTLSARITRRPIDHAYNCFSDYTTPPVGVLWASDPLIAPGQDIPGCTGSNDNLYDLIMTVGQSGTPAGFVTWSSLGHSCDYTGGPVTITDNVHVDCTAADPFLVKDEVTIEGDVVLDVGVRITSGTGKLELDNTATGQGFAFVRSGEFIKDGDTDLVIQDTFVYFSKATSPIRLEGSLSVGDLTWKAPTAGSFEDLALWSDSASPHNWSGQGGVLELEGGFFVPWALVDYSGLSAFDQTEAQFIAARLHTRGNGVLVLEPRIGRSIPIDAPVVAELIR